MMLVSGNFVAGKGNFVAAGLVMVITGWMTWLKV